MTKGDSDDNDEDNDIPIIVSCSPSKVSFAEPVAASETVSAVPRSPEPCYDYAQVCEEVTSPPESYQEIRVTIQEPVPPEPEILPVEENKPKSKLSALMEKSDTQKADQSKSVKVPSPSPKPKAKKQVNNIFVILNLILTFKC